jgi:hypothetical protein
MYFHWFLFENSRDIMLREIFLLQLLLQELLQLIVGMDALKI